jgi:hypothetical protein
VIANYEIEEQRKKVVVAYFKVISQNLPGGTEGNHRNPPQLG